MMLSAHLFPFGLPALLYREPWIRSDLSDVGLTCYTSVFYNFVRLRQVYYSFTYKVVSAVYAAFGTPQYSSPRFNIAYAILMFLFASATTAILLLRLSATDCSQRLRLSVFPALNLSTAGGGRGLSAFSGNCRPVCLYDPTALFRRWNAVAEPAQ